MNVLLSCNLPMIFDFQALIDATSHEGSLDDEVGVRMVALFDHEEVGSNSAQGAGSPVMLDAISRVTHAFCSNVKVVMKFQNNCISLFLVLA